MLDRLLGPWFRWITSLLALIAFVLTAFTMVVILPDLDLVGRTPEATATPGPSPTAPSMTLMRIPVPPEADCGGCHTVRDGGITAPFIPRMGHPVEGWSNCTACHADERLVDVAPGHAGIHRDACLMCHQPVLAGSSPLPRAHHVITGEACITCHGTEAPLPTDMSGRQNCWICHIDQDTKTLFEGVRTPAPIPLTPAPSP
jgi:hypothetical protein